MIEVVESAQRERDKFRLGLYTPPAGRPARLALLHPLLTLVFAFGAFIREYDTFTYTFFTSPKFSLQIQD